MAGHTPLHPVNRLPYRPTVHAVDPSAMTDCRTESGSRAVYLGRPLIPHIMALEYIAPSCFGVDSLGLSAVADNTPWGGMVERKPVQFRTIAGIHRPALGELARRPRSRVSQPLNTADRPTSHNGAIMQRGPLLQPLRSTENILSGPPRARRLAGLSTGRLTAARTASASAASFFLTCPAPQKGESPPWQARFPLGGYASPLFPMAVMVSAAPSSRHKPRQPRVLANHMYVGGHFRAEPDENPSPEYRTRVFSGPSSSVPANI